MKSFFLKTISLVRNLDLKYPFIEDALSNQNSIYRATSAIAFFYYFLLFRAFGALGHWHTQPLSESHFIPQWPVVWSNFISFESASNTITLGLLATALCGAIWYQKKWGRIFAFIGIFEYQAFANSFGSIEHGWLTWVSISFLLIFLPDHPIPNDMPIDKRRIFLTIFWGAQLFLLTTYSLAGIGKVITGIHQFTNNEASMFSSDSAALHVATWLTRTGQKSILGEFIINNPLFAWPGFLGIIYVQIFSVWVAFKPRLHYLWGMLLPISHMMIYLAMNIQVIELIPLALLLLGQSPFAPPRTSIKDTIHELPLLGRIARPFMRQ